MTKSHGERAQHGRLISAHSRRPPAKAACQTDGAQKGTDGDDEDDSARQQMMTIIVAAAVVIVAPTTPVVPCCRTVSGESAGARKGASKISKLW